jgi:hypothetical protein
MSSVRIAHWVDSLQPLSVAALFSITEICCLYLPATGVHWAGKNMVVRARQLAGPSSNLGGVAPQ